MLPDTADGAVGMLGGLTMELLTNVERKFPSTSVDSRFIGVNMELLTNVERKFPPNAVCVSTAVGVFTTADEVGVAIGVATGVGVGLGVAIGVAAMLPVFPGGGVATFAAPPTWVDKMTSDELCKPLR